MYVYSERPSGLRTEFVVFNSSGPYYEESIHTELEAAAKRVAWLNGGPGGHQDEIAVVLDDMAEQLKVIGAALEKIAGFYARS